MAWPETLATCAVMAGGAAYVWRSRRVRTITLRRLNVEPAPTAAGGRPHRRQFPRRYPLAAPAAGGAAALLIWALSLPFLYSLAFGLMVWALTWLIERTRAEQLTARVESQLADAIDLMIGALRAGSPMLSALDVTVAETPAPLRPQLERVTARIRLGDDPQAALRELASVVPLETFRLFALTLAVHWEAGGSLASTLSTVGRSIRDRLEMSRRVRAQGVESRLSSVMVLMIAYGIAYVAWDANPGPFAAFATSDIGSFLVAACIALQALGLVWIETMSRIEF
jgi:Flp pilus assembly protein TadB